MKLEIFTIPALHPTESLAEFNQFCASHKTTSIEKHFVPDGVNSYWSIAVTRDEHSVDKLSPTGKPTPKIDYREILSADDFRIYSGLRELRKTLSNRDGTALYNILSNSQMAKIAEQRIQTKVGLLELEGIGQSRVDKYGDILLETLSQLLQEEEK